MDEIGPNTRLLVFPYYESTLADGVTAFTPYNPMLMPVAPATPIQLASRLIRVEPNRGYFVASKPTPQEFTQFVQFRELFEVSAIALGCNNVTDADIQTLTRLNDKMRTIAQDAKKNAMVRWGNLNSEFHQTLVELARNKFISDQYRNLSFGFLHFQLACAYNVEFTSLTLLD